MPITTVNKAVVPASTDPWNLTTDLRKAIETLNGIVPVASAAEMNAYSPPGGLIAGTTVYRTDTGQLLVYNGSTWGPAGAINGGNPVALSTVLGTWTRPYTSGTRAPRVWSTDGVTAFLTGVVQYGGGTGSILTLPAAFVPQGSDNTYVGASQMTNGPSNVAGGPTVHLVISGATLQIGYQSAALTTGSYLPLAGQYRITG